MEILTVFSIVCSMSALLLALFAVEEEKTMKDIAIANERIQLGIVKDQKQQIEELKYAKEMCDERNKFIAGQEEKLKAYEETQKAIKDVLLSKRTLPEKEDKIKELLSLR